MYICSMKGKIKIGSLCKSELIVIERSVSRSIEIEQGRMNHSRVHRSAKTYTRKSKHRKDFV